jgi:hydroxypyruvate isomerase
MVRQSVCIEMFWEGTPEAEKIRRVAGIGFPAIEFWGWGDKDIESISAAAQETGVSVAAFGCKTEAALVACADGAVLAKGVKRSAEVAQALGCSMLIVTTGNEVEGESWGDTRSRVVDGLKAMASAAADENVTLVLEPLNALVDHEGYWLTRSSDAADIIEEVGSPHLKILYDIYHQQITEGNVIANITRYSGLIGHVHAAGVPGRHELAGGELDYRSIFTAIERSGYEGYVGLEFSPEGPEEDALREAMELASARGGHA